MHYLVILSIGWGAFFHGDLEFLKLTLVFFSLRWVQSQSNKPKSASKLVKLEKYLCFAI
jgi:hypothetical protein